MVNDTDQPNESSFIRCQLSMLWRNLLAVKRHGPRSLVEYCTKTCARGITFNDEFNVEIWKLEDWRRCQGTFEVTERCLCVCVPFESSFL
jgi:hypothetical protein